jgi:hypothetical protein
VFFNTHADLFIFVPGGSTASYRAAANWTNFRNRIHEFGCGLDNVIYPDTCSCVTE